MRDCAAIDRLATPYVDGELSPAERAAIEQHIRVCAPCHSRIGAERAVRELLHTRKPGLNAPCAPAALKAKCQAACRFETAARRWQPWWRTPATRTQRRVRFAAAAVMTVAAGGVLLSVATGRSTRLLAAELTADHMKCFALNAVLRTQHSPEAVRSAMAAGFDWSIAVPDDLERQGLDLVGSRPCLYGEGTTAHIMFRHRGRPVSLFMLPRVERPETMLAVLGHECAIWSVGDRTFVLVARESRAEVEQLARFVQTSFD